MNLFSLWRMDQWNWKENRFKDKGNKNITTNSQDEVLVRTND